MTTQIFAPGGYRFIPAVFQYSGGVAAELDYRIERVTFRKPVPLAQGFERIKRIIEDRGRPLVCLLRLRAEIARAVHGGRLRSIQRDVRRHIGQMGHL